MRRAGLGALLLVATLAAFARLWSAGFVNYDDPTYVTDNPIVERGLTLDGIAWAFRSDVGATWHPLTWLSHMAVVSAGGLDPRWHHLANVLLHAASAVILFLALDDATCATWTSLFVAAVFALHPLHVESVAWVAERKDVLSTLFGFLALAVYVARVRRGRAPGALVTVLFACSLMAKPMLVTLPVLLLLLDWWPLRRIAETTPRAELRALLREKLPLVVLAGASAIVAIITQAPTSTTSLATLPAGDRVAHALISYAAYVGRALWPAKLTVFYPYPRVVGRAAAAAAAAMILALTAGALAARRRAPYLLVGWLWFLVSLLPVIGVIQVGMQSRADRYTYVPLVGLTMLLAFGLVDLGRAAPRVLTPVIAMLGAATIAACAALTWQQTGYWHDDVALYEHALAVTTDNFIAHNNLGLALVRRGDRAAAAAHFEAAIRARAAYPEAHNNLGGVLYLEGRRTEAIAQFTEALRLRPDFTEARNNLRLAETAAAADP